MRDTRVLDSEREGRRGWDERERGVETEGAGKLTEWQEEVVEGGREGEEERGREREGGRLGKEGWREGRKGIDEDETW